MEINQMKAKTTNIYRREPNQFKINTRRIVSSNLIFGKKFLSIFNNFINIQKKNIIAIKFLFFF